MGDEEKRGSLKRVSLTEETRRVSFEGDAEQSSRLSRPRRKPICQPLQMIDKVGENVGRNGRQSNKSLFKMFSDHSGQRMRERERRSWKKKDDKDSSWDRKALWGFLKKWDTSYLHHRNALMIEIIEKYRLVQIDFDELMYNGASLVLTRLGVGMQMELIRKRSLQLYFRCIEVFFRSVTGERFIKEFIALGGVDSVFHAIQIREIDDDEKVDAYEFLIGMISVSSGYKLKEYLLYNKKYMEIVTDLLTLSEHDELINATQAYLEALIYGNTDANICKIARLALDRLRLDFNKKFQCFAVRVLTAVVREREGAGPSLINTLLMNLKSDYEPMLVDLAELSLTIVEGKHGDKLMKALLNISYPRHLSESLSHQPKKHIEKMPMREDEKKLFLEEKAKGQKRKVRTNRFQYGALFCLGHWASSNEKLRDRIIHRGLIGVTVAALGSSTYPKIQEKAIRLIIFLYNQTPELGYFIKELIGLNLLMALMEQGTQLFIPATACVHLRSVGGAIKDEWNRWLAGFETQNDPCEPACLELSLEDHVDYVMTLNEALCLLTAKINRIMEPPTYTKSEYLMRNYSQMEITDPGFETEEDWEDEGTIEMQINEETNPLHGFAKHLDRGKRANQDDGISDLTDQQLFDKIKEKQGSKWLAKSGQFSWKDGLFSIGNASSGYEKDLLAKYLDEDENLFKQERFPQHP